MVGAPRTRPAKDLKELIALRQGQTRRRSTSAPPASARRRTSRRRTSPTRPSIDAVHVPYKGEAPAMIGPDRRPDPASRRRTSPPRIGLRAARAGCARSASPAGSAPQLPDVPAVAETLPGFENAGWFGLMAPAGTPQRGHRQGLARHDEGARRDATCKARFNVQGMAPVGNTPAEFAAAIREEIGALGQGHTRAQAIIE